jgi:hypothetical protein
VENTGSKRLLDVKIFHLEKSLVTFSELSLVEEVAVQLHETHGARVIIFPMY